jgi:hypothetical protein
MGLALFLLRMYRTTRQLREEYHHRQLALETFATFRESAKDDATRDLVLRVACRSIFTAPSTGLITKSDAEGAAPDPEMVAKFLAILKA